MLDATLHPRATSHGQTMDGLGSRCKIVVVGDTQCGKTALLHVFAKDCYPENYVPTVFENYTASFEIDKHRIELNMWDTSGKTNPHLSFSLSLCPSAASLTNRRQINPSSPAAMPVPGCDRNPPGELWLCEFFSWSTPFTECNRTRCSASFDQHTSNGPADWFCCSQSSRSVPLAPPPPWEQNPLSIRLSCFTKFLSASTSSGIFLAFDEARLTAGSSYYDNVRPLAYPDSDAVLICFDISRPETLDSVIKKWQGETQEFCPNAKVVLVGCKLDMRTDVNTLRELSKQRLIPVTHEQGSTIARQIAAVAYVECTSKVSENSVRDVFHVTTVASVRRPHKPQLKRSSSRREA
ncbi:hypothetical protein L3Q82_014012 [Scortum barcoo]|uniref:Uncharacterized protein n=1 Tax=Scortum barcoo TaxID=214431 RepID=A0ACB8VVZ6_9TELE|nr:hypothetical protein L3Q82_014012 [Scortum barcoo]